jgi:hypothetical protein
MSKEAALFSDILPSAAPTPEELADWHALPRAEQEKRLALALEQGFKSPPTVNDIDAIIIEAKTEMKLAGRG